MRSITCSGPGQEPAERAEGLGQRAHPDQREVGIVREAAGGGAEDGVGLVEQEERAVAAASGGDLLHRGGVAVHREDRVGDHDRRRGGVLCQQGREVRRIAVAVDGARGTASSRQPSMIEAWFSSSERTRTSGPPSTLSAPRLAAKPVGKQTAASVPFQSASAASSVACTGREPVTSRERPAPAPHRSSAACAAAMTAGCALKPEVVVGGEGDDGAAVERTLRAQGVERPGRPPPPAVDHGRADGRSAMPAPAPAVRRRPGRSGVRRRHRP